eukprot:TRINITY_DN40071_c0_g1_i1.p1 TRINITY_DN40071_c0_g1~~TRINITY_DN40071_c0_g1_i1.p1  ORF type:complete len:480 (-),score=35.36 TRINITY_DN40071_c0_g1_i1:276-1715(-)
MTSDVVQKVRVCLADTHSQRRAKRDSWSNAFEAISASTWHTSQMDPRDRLDILAFLDALPTVSPVHSSRARFKVKSLLGLGDDWVAAARKVKGEGPVAFALDGEGNGHTARAKKCARASAACIGVIVMIGVALFLLYHWLGHRVPSLPASDWLLLVMASVGLLLLALTCVAFLRMVCQGLRPVAAVFVMFLCLSFLLATGALTWLLLSKYFPRTTHRFIVSTCMLHFYIWMIVHTNSILSAIISSPSRIYAALQRCFKYAREGAHLYSHAALSKEVKAAAGLSGTFREPLLHDPDSTDVASWAALLETIVNTNENVCFELEAYERLIQCQQSGDKATITDVCRFLIGYLRALLYVVPRSFRRYSLLQRAQRGVRASREVTGSSDQMSWQLLLDQYDWYRQHGQCFCDVMARLASRDVRAGRLVRLMRGVDRALGFWLFLLCQPALFVPTPEQRAEELENRLEVVRALVAGKSLLPATSA